MLNQQQQLRRKLIMGSLIGSFIESAVKSGGLDVLSSFFGASRNQDINDYDKLTAAYEKLQKKRSLPKMTATDLLLHSAVKPSLGHTATSFSQNISSKAVTDLLVHSPEKTMPVSTIGKVVSAAASAHNSSTAAGSEAASALSSATLSSSASASASAAASAVQALKGGSIKAAAQTLRDPRFAILLGAIALIWACIRSERELRNINIKVIPTETPTAYTIGLGNSSRERRFSFVVQQGKPIRTVAEPGIDLDKAYFTNNKDSSNVQSSSGFSTLFGFLNIFSFKRKELTTVINIFVTDPSNPSSLKNNPNKLKGTLSQGELVQVFQVRGKDRVFETFKRNQLSSIESSQSTPDRIQRIFFSTTDLKYNPTGNMLEAVQTLPMFNGSDEFLRVRVQPQPIQAAPAA
jgi:hypothetical protein